MTIKEQIDFYKEQCRSLTRMEMEIHKRKVKMEEELNALLDQQAMMKAQGGADKCCISK